MTVIHCKDLRKQIESRLLVAHPKQGLRFQKLRCRRLTLRKILIEEQHRGERRGEVIDRGRLLFERIAMIEDALE